MVLHSQTITRSPGRRVAEYACHGRSSQAVCTSAAYVTGPIVEPFVEQIFFGELFAKQRRKPPSSLRLDQLREQLEGAEKALEEYRDSPRILHALGESRFVGGLKVRTRRVDLLMQDVASEERRVSSVVMPPASELETSWPSLTVRERRQAISEVIDCVFVTRGWGNIGERAFVCFRGEQPPDLPSRGAHRPVSIPLIRLLCQPRRRPKLPPKWDRSRIHGSTRGIPCGTILVSSARGVHG